jgi:hypothetical protein
MQLESRLSDDDRAVWISTGHCFYAAIAFGEKELCAKITRSDGHRLQRYRNTVRLHAEGERTRALMDCWIADGRPAQYPGIPIATIIRNVHPK